MFIWGGQWLMPCIAVFPGRDITIPRLQHDPGLIVALQVSSRPEVPGTRKSIAHYPAISHPGAVVLISMWFT